MIGEWTTSQPTTSGYYWAFDGDEVVFAEVFGDKLKPTATGVEWEWIACAHADIDEEWRSLSDFTHWIGPLPRPEPPQP